LADTIIPSASTLQAQQASVTQPLVPTGIVDDVVDQEKTIRIGVTNTREPVQLTAKKGYEIRDMGGVLYSTESPGALTTVSFDFLNKIYVVITPTKTVNIPTPPRFSGTFAQANGAPDQDTIFEITSLNNRPSWSSTLNDNTFRGLIEIRYVEATDRVWVVNELLLESYLKGIAETSNNSPYEYQKALIIAARTYAQYHINRNTKYSGEFTMRSTDHDQVYRGYGAEVRLPNVARAVQDTRGVEVFHSGSLVITPYYSQSDGRTRAWEEVWGGGPKAWLVSKEVPSDKGLPMLGHGVGISARGALSMALEGKNFEEILKYFYTGIELRRRYL
ncbi:MAG: SpoIID/LytB domain-containing protein, partial [bacterium]|nr:SpoIID/LytB domain-containing protein [bacterium]